MYMLSPHSIYFSLQHFLTIIITRYNNIYPLKESKYHLKTHKMLTFWTYLLSNDLCQDVVVQIFICIDFMFTLLHGV